MNWKKKYGPSKKPDLAGYFLTDMALYREEEELREYLDRTEERVQKYLKRSETP
jgi:hypothetical protein